jgi:hypothetical protein
MSRTRARLVRRNARQLAGDDPRACNVSAHNTGGPSRRIALDRALKKFRRVGRTRLNFQSFQCPAVQKKLVVRLLERHGILRRDLIQLGAREGSWIVRELLVRPSAYVVNPCARTIAF